MRDQAASIRRLVSRLRLSLKSAGCEKVFAEQVSSVAQREQLEAALEYLGRRHLVVTKLDRLAWRLTSCCHR
jgi:DNA invertase Pin-like site-specific DNA recombinase